MSVVEQILNRAYKSAVPVNIDKDSKIIIFSDLHRGDNSYADDFRHNMKIYSKAIRHYYEEGYTYIENGDGVELWENRSFAPIFHTYKSSFKVLQDFNRKKRLFLIWGNHDMVFRNPIFLEKILHTYFTPKNIAEKDLLFNVKYHESLLLNIKGCEKSIFVIHGHQADYLNYLHWKLSRFIVRYFWKYMQKWFGIKDPTSPAKNFKGLIKVEEKLHNWILKNNRQMVISGHTHRPRFPEPGKIPLFNDGSCVHPRSIIGIEIADLKISLIKWQETMNERTNKKEIVKVILEGPVTLNKFL